jgi:hypothetical protein
VLVLMELTAADLVAGLRGCGAEREVAYAELFRREAAAHHLYRQHGGGGSSRAAAAAWQREELQGLGVAALRARALAGGHREADVEAAADAAEPKAALVALLLAQAAAAEESGDGSDGDDGQSLADIAAVCASPLCAVLCDASVGVGEYQRAALLLAALSGVSGGVGSACTEPERCNLWSAWSALDDSSALGAVLAKDPAALTAGDALTVACAVAPLPVQWSTSAGAEATFEAVGISAAEWAPMVMSSMFLCNSCTPADDRILALAPLLLELLKSPPPLAAGTGTAGGEPPPTPPPPPLPEFALAGVLAALWFGVLGRAAVAVQLLELGAIEVLAQILRQASPRELVAASGFARRPHGFALCVLKEIAEAAGVDLTARLLSNGTIDIVVAAISETEQLGEDGVNGGVLLLGALFLLITLDGEEIEQIEERVRTGLPSSALRFLLDSVRDGS